MTTKDKRRARAALRRRCRALARRLGVRLEYERPDGWGLAGGAAGIWWVDPPVGGPYGPGLRWDPLTGMHAACDLEEAWDKIRLYQADMALAALGASEAEAAAVRNEPDPMGLRDAWLCGGDVAAGHAFADWLAEDGRDVTTGMVRRALGIP
jgi:hypothetical protein